MDNQSAIRERVTQLRKVSTIEDEAYNLHLSLWNHRHELLGTNDAENPLDILEPAIALHFLGFSVETDSDLGEMFDRGRRVRVAGLIDRKKMCVRISNTLPSRERRFTVAHELGHGVKHPALTTLHRDRAIDGPVERRDWREREADSFASCFLMPARLVLQRFVEYFGCQILRFDENSVYGLQLRSVDQALQHIRCTRHMSLLVAKTNSYMGRPFVSLSDYFGVSAATMAIRLEELGLIEDFAERRFF